MWSLRSWHYLVQLQAGLMPRVDCVQPQFLQAVGIVVTSVALEVHRVADGHTLEPPLVGLATLLDVGHQLVLLHMLVCLAV
jgi:hypothetical protein